MSVPNRLSGDQRTYIEDNRYVDRPKLPSISNFLEVIGRPDFIDQKTHRPTLPSTNSPTKYAEHTRSVITPAAGQPWSPNGSLRHSLLPPFEKIDAPSQQTGSNIYPTSREWQHRSSITTPSLSHSDARSSVSYSIPTPSSRHTSITLLQAPILSSAKEPVSNNQNATYMYEGPSFMKLPNDETINPKWGTTKAGKPRKRLGQACNTCREKKIKCDPSFPKCTQCQRFGRECKFEAPRHTPKSPKQPARTQSPSSDNFEDPTIYRRRPSIALTETSSCSESGHEMMHRKSDQQINIHSFNIAAQVNDGIDHSTPSKRLKLQDQTNADIDAILPNAIDNGFHEDRSSPRRDNFTSEADPYVVEPKLTEQYLKAYFALISSTGTSFFPERLFLQWVKKERHKTMDENLVIYCMLAAGCRYARNSDRANHEVVFKKIASEGVTQAVGQFSIPLIHARLTMCLLEFQLGDEQRAWDLGGAAMRAACAMRMNTEDGISNLCQKQHSLYLLGKEQSAECLRRTFLLAYVMDRFAVSCLGFSPTFNGADLFLHLPCTDNAFEKGHIPNTRIFDGDEGVTDIVDVGELSKLSSFAFLAQIAALSCDAHMLATQVRHQESSDHRRERYATNRTRLENQLCSWNKSYTSYLRLALPRTLHTSTSSTPQPLGGLQIIMYQAYMVLYRYGYHKSMDQHQIKHRAREAYMSARSCLEIAQRLASVTYQEIQDHHIAASNAVFGCAIVEAVDILTAAGLNADFWGIESRLMGLMMKGAVPLLEGLAERWKCAKSQRELVSHRTKSLFSAVHAGPSQGKMAFSVVEPMVQAFNKDEDIIYGIDRLRYFAIMEWHNSVRDMASVIEISDLR